MNKPLTGAVAGVILGVTGWREGKPVGYGCRRASAAHRTEHRRHADGERDRDRNRVRGADARCRLPLRVSQAGALSNVTILPVRK